MKDIQEVLKQMKLELEKAAEATARIIHEITQDTVSISKFVKVLNPHHTKTSSFHVLHKRYNFYEISKEFRNRNYLF